MKRITAKLMATGFFVMFLTSFIPNVLWMIFGDGRDRQEVEPIAVLIGGVITVSFTIFLYSFFVDRIINKRIRKLNDLTKEVMSGNFEQTINDPHKDEVSELTNNFNQMINELKNNEYLNKEFVRNFSHELKTPLSAIKGYAELIHSETLSDIEKEQYSRIIIDESTRLSQLARNMLLISQIDNQVIVPKQDTFNVTELLRNVIQLQQLDWELKHIDFELNVEEVTITSNKELLYQVFQNLISNAIRFSDDKDKITISLSQNENIEFSITNKGYLNQEEVTQVFDLFYIKDKSRSTKSNGVGLTLTKKIVEKLDGSISVTSDNKLITFKVKL